MKEYIYNEHGYDFGLPDGNLCINVFTGIDVKVNEKEGRANMSEEEFKKLI